MKGSLVLFCLWGGSAVLSLLNAFLRALHPHSPASFRESPWNYLGQTVLYLILAAMSIPGMRADSTSAADSPCASEKQTP